MMELGSERGSLSTVDDQIGCPTCDQDLARAIVKILSIFDKKELRKSTYHWCGDSSCSWHEFAYARPSSGAVLR